MTVKLIKYGRLCGMNGKTQLRFPRIILLVLLVSVSITNATRQPCQDDDTLRCVLTGNLTRVRFLSRVTSPGSPVPFSFDAYSTDFQEVELSSHFRVRMESIAEIDPQSMDTRQSIDIFAPIEMWNTTLSADRFTLWVKQAERADTCAQSPNSPLCVELTVDNTLLNEEREITIQGPLSRTILKNGSMFVRSVVAGWEWDAPTTVIEITYQLSIPSLIMGEIESIIVAQKPLTATSSTPVTVSFTVVTTNAAFEMAFYGNAADTFIIDPKERTVKLQSPQSTTPYAWTYVIRPLSKAELMNSTHTSDLSSIGGSPYIFIASLGAAGVLVICGLIGLVWCLVRKRNQKKKSRSRSSSRA